MAEADPPKAAELSPEGTSVRPEGAPAPASGQPQPRDPAENPASDAPEAPEAPEASDAPDAPEDPETPDETGAADTDGEPVKESADEAPADDESEPACEDLAALSAAELRAGLREANAQNAQMKDGLLRARAEVENIRRRSQNEIVATRKFAIEGFAQELLGVRDSLDRASSVALDEGAGEAVRQMKEGLGLTLKQFDLAMSRFAVVEVEAAPGVRFDPERHQAISTAPCGDIDADHIVSVVQKGFLLKERLLRPAMVVVAAAKDDAQSATLPAEGN